MICPENLKKLAIFVLIVIISAMDINDLKNFIQSANINFLIGSGLSTPLDKVSQDSLPILSTGVCVIAGQMLEMPIVVQIDRIEDEYKPLNETIDVVAKWTEE